MPKAISARQKLLDAAAELFYAEGVGATGIDAIIARAGVAKMSLYNNFTSKADLVNAYVQRRCDEWHVLYAARVASAHTPQQRIIAVFESYLDHAAMAYTWGFRGCGLLNAAAELPAGDPGRATVAGQKAEAEQLFRDHLQALTPDAGGLIDQTAEHLSFVLEGAMSRAGLEGHDGRLQSALALASTIIEQHLRAAHHG